MRGKNVARFEKTLHFFNWLDHQELECDGCGEVGKMHASIFNSDYKPWKPPEALHFCERCWKELHD